jgi:hypothetical protein
LRGASSQKVSKNPKIYYIHSSLPKNAKNCFGFLGLLGVKRNTEKLRNIFVSIPEIEDMERK